MFMARFKEMIRWQTISGDKTTIGDVTITPQAQTFTIRLPYGGLVWNRPVAVLVERGGQTERISIVDITRVIQLGLLGLSLVFSIAIFVLSTQQRTDQNE